MTGKFFGKISRKRFSGFLIVMVVTLLLSAAAYAEEIIYTGDGKGLRNSPSWYYDKTDISLFPGTEKAPLTSGNKVTLNYAPETVGALHPEFVFGGISELDNVVNNKVILLNGRVDGNVSAGDSINGDSIGNDVSMSGGSVGDNVCSGYSSRGSAASNSVTISGGSVGAYIFGGVSGDGGAMGNIVTMSGGHVGEDVCGGLSGDGCATGNIVSISGGSVGEDVCGGLSVGDATGNIVTIIGGSLGENIYGGYSDHGEVTGNTVTISGNPDLTKANIYGGFSEEGDKDAFTDNILNFKSSGLPAKGVGNFEHYDFYLPDGLEAGAVMLSVTEKADLKGTTVEVYLQGSTKLRKGGKIALIHSEKGVSNAPKNISCKAQQNGTLYEFSIYTDSNNLWAKLETVSNAAK